MSDIWPEPKRPTVHALCRLLLQETTVQQLPRAFAQVHQQIGASIRASEAV